MIHTHRKHLEERCRERGYRLEDVMGCVVRREGDLWTIDPDHPDYPRKSPPGPGTHLSSLLSRMGLKAIEGCSCKGRARQMNIWGPDGCESRLDEIVGWMEEEAKSRGLPFLRWPAKTLVRLAIHRSRKHKMLPPGT